jgi:hypothetical protein
MLAVTSFELAVAAWAGWWNWLSGCGAKSGDRSMSETLAGGILPTTTREAVSVHDVEPLRLMLGGTGDGVVTENSDAVVVLKVTEPIDDRQLIEDVENGLLGDGEGQIVSSDGEKLASGAVVASTDCIIDQSSDVHEVVATEVGSKPVASLHGVPVASETRLVVESGAEVDDEHGEVTGGQIVRITGGSEDPDTVLLFVVGIEL